MGALAIFLGVLWELSGTPRVAIGGLEMHAPGYLVAVAVVYAGVSTTLTHLLGRPFVQVSDELHARGKRDVRIGARDADIAGLERLAQRVERLTGEFREFVEEQDAVMRERDFARPRAQAAADERRHRRGMVR